MPLNLNNIPAAIRPAGKAANANYEGRNTDLQLMLCPSDIGRSNPYDDTGLPTTSGGPWARGNYGYNAGLALILSNELVWNKTQADPDGNLMTCGRGLGGADVACTAAQITDGTSHTIAIGEIRVGLTPIDRRGVWAMPMVGSNLLSQHGANYAGGPNDCTLGTDDIMDHDRIITEFGLENLAAECMAPCGVGSGGCSGWDVSAQVAARSRHVGGIFAAMCDGSVQFISDFIDVGEETNGLRCDEKLFGVWQRLNCPDDGYIVKELE